MIFNALQRDQTSFTTIDSHKQFLREWIMSRNFISNVYGGHTLVYTYLPIPIANIHYIVRA